jgi:hypothetical protein
VREISGLLALAVLLVAAAWVVLAGAPRPASAAPVALGQAAPTGIPAECKGPAELVESSTAGINPYVVPRAGTITSWSTNAGAGPGQAMKMKVFRPVGGFAHTYTVIAHDGPRLLAASVLNTFSVDIPVQAGDVIGLNAGNASVATPNACLYPTNVATDILDLSTADTPDGASVTFPLSSPGGRPNVAATLQPAPTVTAIRPSSGWFLGGTQVTIAGSDFEAVSAVSFGETPALSYSVDSESQITAISPPGSAGAPVDVSVTTLAGRSATGAADKFTYTLTSRLAQVSRCTVPKLKGKTLKAARHELKKADCRLGEIKGQKRKFARVRKQGPKPGKVLAPGAEISITLGTRHHRQPKFRR